MAIFIKKKNRGKFTKDAKASGESVQEHAHTILNNPKATKLQKKRAQFVINAKKWKHEEGGTIHKIFGHRSFLDNNRISTKDLKKNHSIVSMFQQGGTTYAVDQTQPQIVQRYVSLLNNGINPQTAFDSSHLSIIEDGRPGKYYSFGKRATNLDNWTKNVVDSLTVGRYKNLNNTTNFQQFKQKLKQKNYNTRPAFYNIEINRGRDKNKRLVNQWNQQHGLPLIAGIQTEYTNDLV